MPAPHFALAAAAAGLSFGAEGVTGYPKGAPYWRILLGRLQVARDVWRSNPGTSDVALEPWSVQTIGSLICF